MSTTHRLLTVEDLDSFPDDGVRYEIVGGILISTRSLPMRHQFMQSAVGYPLLRHARNRDIGRGFFAPVDVRFSRYDQVRPDVLVLFNEHRSWYQGSTLSGPPDLVVEVITAESRHFDETVKYALYERNGVPEYCLADPETETIRQFVLRDGRFEELAIEGGVLRSVVLPGLEIDLAEIAAELDW